MRWIKYQIEILIALIFGTDGHSGKTTRHLRRFVRGDDDLDYDLESDFHQSWDQDIYERYHHDNVDEISEYISERVYEEYSWLDDLGKTA